MKVYIRGAGGTIVTKSILNGTSKLKWLFQNRGIERYPGKTALRGLKHGDF